MKKVILLTILIQSSSVLLAGLVQWKIVDGGNDHWYQAVSVPEGISWYNSHIAASNMDGYLVTIASSEENDFVFNLIDNSLK